jgi:hypothetical protein
MKTSTPWVLGSILAMGLAAPASVAQVGDADSFGHNVVFLGHTQTLAIGVKQSCVGNDPTKQRCIIIVPGGTTTFKETDLAVIRLPARAARTLVCTTTSLFVNANSDNQGTVPATQLLTFGADVIVENSVLDDPSLINPLTGAAFNGRLQVSPGGYSERHTMAAGASEQMNEQHALMCNSGLLRKSTLMQVYGLSDVLATQFFRRPMTLRFGAVGDTALVNSAQLFYAVRLYGDN